MSAILPNRSLVESLIRQSLYAQLGRATQAVTPAPTLVVNSSARHMHVTQENLEILFGPGTQLKVHKMLYQEGQFASTSTVTLVGPRDRIIPNLRILGPCRNITQIELAYTDAIYLGINVPVRASGDIKGTAAGVVIGPKGVVEMKEGIIRAARHVHMNASDAAFYGVKNGEMMTLMVEAAKCTTRFDDLLVRVDPSFKLEVHIDTDEANSCDLARADRCELVRKS
jgi:putative phosphotransacetylase